MRRRDFLLGLAAAPLFIRRAFADVATPPDALDFEAARRRAQATGRRIVALVVPGGEKWQRGVAWGEVFVHGSDEDLAPFDGADLIATAVPKRFDDAFFVVIEPDGTARGISLAEEPPPYLPVKDPVELRLADERTSAHRLAIFVAAIHAGLGAVDAAKGATVRARYAPPREVPGAMWLGRDCPTCGMGHVPAKANKLLMLLTRTQKPT